MEETRSEPWFWRSAEERVVRSLPEASKSGVR